jgi:hypothetical protein
VKTGLLTPAMRPGLLQSGLEMGGLASPLDRFV